MSPQLPDVAYFVRPGEDNQPLRYSLRSLRNLPHGRVFIVGHQPAWVTGVTHIPGNPHPGNKQRNVWANVRTIAACDEISETCIVMNDDFYVMAPITTVPHLYRGRLEDQIAKAKVGGWWRRSLIATHRYLQEQGHPDPISWELHTPFPIQRAVMTQALAGAEGVQRHNPPQWRTLYGYAANLEGTQARDCKYRWHPDQPFWSSSPTNFVKVQAELYRTFGDPSPYET